MAQKREDTRNNLTGEKEKSSSVTDPTFARKRPLLRLAHELKTPISAIAAAADVMRQEQLGPLGNEKYITYANDIHASSLLVLSLIDRMMALRAGDEAGARLDKVEIDLHKLLSGICSAMQPLASSSGIELSFSVVNKNSDAPVHVLADAVSLQQILLNLINNSIKFTDAGGCVEISARKMDDKTTSLSVVDTGSGMTRSQIEMALSGETIPSELNQKPGRGMGIGLPLVRALCEANGAQFELISNGKSGGTTALVTFPSERGVEA